MAFSICLCLKTTLINITEKTEKKICKFHKTTSILKDKTESIDGGSTPNRSSIIHKKSRSARDLKNIYKSSFYKISQLVNLGSGPLKSWQGNEIFH